jgi:hypothetical protein
MKRTLIYTAVIAALLPVMVTAVNAADKDQDRERLQTQDKTQVRDQIYGSQLMTAKERAAYLAKIRAAKTEQEREKIRAEQHERMMERAKEKGITLPDEPPARGMGPQPMNNGGPGMGGGVGPGGGMGPGPGTGGGMRR